MREKQSFETLIKGQLQTGTQNVCVPKHAVHAPQCLGHAPQHLGMHLNTLGMNLNTWACTSTPGHTSQHPRHASQHPEHAPQHFDMYLIALGMHSVPRHAPHSVICLCFLHIQDRDLTVLEMLVTSRN